ncbi:MAG: CotH kinase family protein [Eubacteriales bacterium]|nr:CotH kinase family protein [Eubacteriales bacterium]MDD4476052.1 CotH kinase family protein [Eubacteriales bacterium]
MNKKFKIIIIILMTLLVLSGCDYINDILNESNDNSSTFETNSDATKIDNDELTVVDKELWYDKSDDYSVVTMYLTVSEGNRGDNTNHTWQEVNSYSIFYYDDLGIDRYAVEGLLQVGDENGPVAGMLGFDALAPNARVNVRGNTTSTSPQKSFKIELDQGKGMWREQRTIILNKHVWDPTRIRNKLTYDLLRDIPGAISARTQFVHLYVKDDTSSNTTGGQFVDYGLFTNVEQFNGRYLRNHAFDNNGSFYKAEMFEFYRYEDTLKLSSDPTYDQKAFEDIIEIKGNADHTKFLKMLDDVNNTLLPINTVFTKYFDEENYFTWLAFQILIGNADTTSRNFFIYSPLNSEKWYFISWDNDGAWDVDRMTEPIEAFGHEYGISNYWGVVLHQRVLKQPEYRKKLDDKINELREILTEEMLKERIDAYSKVVKPFIYSMPDIAYAREAEDTLNETLNKMPKLIEVNYKMYTESLKRPMPFFLGTPEIIEKGKVSFRWDTSYDFNEEKIYYKLQISDSYLFDKIIFESDNLLLPEIDVPITLAKGQYFYRVVATNQSGYSQAAFDYYVDKDYIKNYGIISFFVDGDDIWLDQ